MQRPNGTSACASCRHQRKKCAGDCILAPYFPTEKRREFEAVHRVFGVSNAIKIINDQNTEEERRKATNSMIWEAFCWQRDRIQGPYGHFTRVLEDIRFYKTQYFRLVSQLQTASQARNMVYGPPLAAAAAPPVLINEVWNNDINNNGGVSTMNNMNLGGLNNNVVVQDRPFGNLMMNHSSNPNVVVQNMDHQNGSRALILGQQQDHNIINHQNGSASLILPHQQHRPIGGFNQQYYLAAGQRNSSTDANGNGTES